MKDYFKYLTVGELQDQIMDTLISAKQKINRISRKSVDESSFVNDKFYNYVSEIKNKQKKYDYIMNQSQELNCLLNERRKRIDESLERYERNKKCKTLSSFHQNLYRTATSIEVTPSNYDSLRRLNNLVLASESKLQVEHLKQTHQGQENGKTKQESSLLKNMQIVKRRQKILTEPLQIIKEKESESKKLRSITKVINIRIDNLPTQKLPQKLFSFAKNTIKYDIKANQNQNINVKAAKKKIHFQTVPAQPAQNMENKIENLKVQIKSKDNKNTHKLLNIQQKSIKRIRERMKQNQERLLKLSEKQKKQECTKMLLLKYEYQNIQRNDLKVKLASCFATYLKAKQNRNARC